MEHIVTCLGKCYVLAFNSFQTANFFAKSFCKKSKVNFYTKQLASYCTAATVKYSLTQINRKWHNWYQYRLKFNNRSIYTKNYNNIESLETYLGHLV